MANTAAIALGIVLIVLILVFIIVWATGNIHFGKSPTGDPTNDQVLQALKNGVTIKSTSSQGHEYRTVVTWKDSDQKSRTGINLGIDSSLSISGTSQKIDGDRLDYWLKPKTSDSGAAGDQGILYTITSSQSNKNLVIFPDLTTPSTFVSL